MMGSNPLVRIGSDNTPVTNSLAVAKMFKKKHYNIMQAIRNHIKKGHRGFFESTYRDMKNRSYPIFEMDRLRYEVLTTSYVDPLGSATPNNIREQFRKAFEQFEPVKDGVKDPYYDKTFVSEPEVVEPHEEPAPAPATPEDITKSLMKVGDEEVNAVDARELHAFLGVGTRFNDWIDRRIAKYGFAINSDYSVLSSGTSTGGEERKDYWISMDMAKELSMVENNSKGREARLYFIECEKKLKAVTKQEPMDQLDVLQGVVNSMIQIRDESRAGIAEVKDDVKRLDNKVDEVVEAVAKKVARVDAEAERMASYSTPGVEVPDRTLRQEVVRHMQIAAGREMKTHGIDSKAARKLAWNKLYNRFDDMKRIRVRERAKNSGKKPMPYIEENGWMRELHAVMFKEYPA